MYLPEEIHARIVPYLADEDLQKYRLGSRALARIGAEELFRTVKFHASVRSTNRIVTLANDEVLSKHVRALVWDSNIWDLDIGIRRPDDTDENFATFWTYITKHRYPVGVNGSIFLAHEFRWRRPRIPVSATGEYDATNLWQEYLRRLKDETNALDGVLSFHRLYHLLQKFDCLEKIYIINGDFQFRNRKVVKQHFRCGPPDPNELYSRGEALHNRWNLRTTAGVEALRNTLLSVGPTLRKLRVNATHWKVFVNNFRDHDGFSQEAINLTEPCYFEDYNIPAGGSGSLSFLPQRHYEDITSLHLTITTYDIYEPHIDWVRFNGPAHTAPKIWNFLRRLTKLQSLKLSLERFSPEYGPMSSIAKVIPADHTWHSLRKLSLTYFGSEENDLICLLDKHASTLKDLRLCNICLGMIKPMDYPPPWPDSTPNPANWPSVIQTVKRKLNLSNAECSGKFFQTKDDRTVSFSWDMNLGLGRKLAAYLVNGGECPITIGNAIETNKDMWEYGPQWRDRTSPFIEEVPAEVLALRQRHIEEFGGSDLSWRMDYDLN